MRAPWFKVDLSSDFQNKPFFLIPPQVFFYIREHRLHKLVYARPCPMLGCLQGLSSETALSC